MKSADPQRTPTVKERMIADRAGQEAYHKAFQASIQAQWEAQAKAAAERGKNPNSDVGGWKMRPKLWEPNY